MAPLPRPVRHDGVVLPYGAVLDLDTCPFELVGDVLLGQYLRARDIRLPLSTTTRSSLIALAKQAVEREKEPLTQVDYAATAGKKEEYAAVLLYTEVQGSRTKKIEKILERIRSSQIENISDGLVNRELGAGHPVVRKRALDRLRDGNVIFETVLMFDAVLDADAVPVSVIEVEIGASQRGGGGALRLASELRRPPSCCHRGRDAVPGGRPRSSDHAARSLGRRADLRGEANAEVLQEDRPRGCEEAAQEARGDGQELAPPSLRQVTRSWFRHLL